VGCGGEVRRKYFLEKSKAVGGGFEVARDFGGSKKIGPPGLPGREKKRNNMCC
jgi:hypothetical protein